MSATKICIRFLQARSVQLVFARTVPVKIGKKFNSIFTDEKVIGSQSIVNLNDFVGLYRKSQSIANQLMLGRFIKPLSGQFRAALVPHRILIGSVATLPKNGPLWPCWAVSVFACWDNPKLLCRAEAILAEIWQTQWHTLTVQRRKGRLDSASVKSRAKIGVRRRKSSSQRY